MPEFYDQEPPRRSGVRWERIAVALAVVGLVYVAAARISGARAWQFGVARWGGQFDWRLRYLR